MNAGMNDARSRMPLRSLLPALAIGGVSLAAALAAASPAADGAVAAIFPPWWDATRVAAATAPAGVTVRFGALPFIVVVAADAQGTTPPGAALYRAGAWLLLNPQTLTGCLSATDPVAMRTL